MLFICSMLSLIDLEHNLLYQHPWTHHCIKVTQ